MRNQEVITDNRNVLITEAVTVAMETAHGIQRLNEEQTSQLISNLVRAKLLTADDSYRLKDKLQDKDSWQRAIDHRIERALLRRGVTSQPTIDALRARIQKLELNA